MSKYRVGVDIGGTFTDAMMIDIDSGEVHLSKVSTTPKDPSIGFLQSVEKTVQGIHSSQVAQIIHATTIATNAIIEGKVGRGAFVTTKGFRDLLEIQRQIRPRLYDMFFEKPRALIPRYLCFEVTERLSAEGDVLSPLDENEARRIAEQLKGEKVEAVAICFLHSYLNPVHEKRVAEIISEVYPGVSITTSSDISPQFREYFRASTAVINTVLMPIVARYVERLERELTSRGFPAQLYIMQSNGGLMTSTTAKKKPAFLVESGPAAGVIAASYAAKIVGFENVLSFDMGGTTAKVGLIERGSVRITSNYEVGAVATAEIGGLTKGSGYPLRTPVLDLVEVGSGGGSIAWVDPGGLLHVGPQSAGADPGPACYMRGGTQPTVTDANVVLERLDGEYFLGGEVKLSPVAARDAILEGCGDIATGDDEGDAVAAANAVVEIANTNMLRAIRLASVERGYDPRDFLVVAFGGAGPMHINSLAKELELPNILIPPSPGLFSAMGLLVTDLRHDYVQTYVKELGRLDVANVNSYYADSEEQAAKVLLQEGVDRTQTVLQRYMDMRYVGQSYELLVPVPSGELSSKDVDLIRRNFFDEHEKAYAHSVKTEPVEVVNLRLVATGIIPRPKLKEVPSGGSAAAADAVKRRKKVFFTESSGFVECNVYDRYRLKVGNVIPGPAIIEEVDSTTVIHPNHRAEVEKFGFVFIRRD